MVQQTDGGRELLVLTYKIAVEALAELKHTGSVRQGPRDVERLKAWNEDTILNKPTAVQSWYLEKLETETIQSEKKWKPTFYIYLFQL